MTIEPSDRKARKWQPSRKQIVLALLVVLLAAAGIFAYSVIHCVGEVVRDAYAQEWVAGMVIRHMEWHEGSWPNDWEDLKEPYEVSAGRSGQPWSFGELRSRVAIDFAANPAELSQASETDGRPPFRAIYLRNGKQTHWAGGEPNSRVLRYLKERAQRPASYKYPEPPATDEKASRRALLELRARFYVDDGGHVTSVKMSSHGGLPGYTDAAMVHLKPLKNLRELLLANSNITDTGIEHIRGLSNLEELHIHGTDVTDAGLQHLKGMENLKTLVLPDDNFTDAGLKHIKHLRSLKLLNLNGAEVTDAGLVHLHELEKLEEVMLGDTNVTNEGLQQLRSILPKCKIYH